MGGYICVKPMQVSGKAYVPGDLIPEEEILPGRVRTLKRNGFIAPAEAAEARPVEEKSPADGTISVPLHTEDGVHEVPVGAQAIVKAFNILQLAEKDAKAAIAEEEDDDVLLLVNAVDRRKNVQAAAKERHDEIRL